MKQNAGGEVQKARIAAWQAVVVATITAAGGVVAGYLSHPPADSKPVAGSELPTRQHYLVIHGVEGKPGQMIRVIAHVNNLLYAYPADVTFTPVSTGMPEQKLPLPLFAGQYTVSFEAQIMGRDCTDVRPARSRTTPQFDSGALPSTFSNW
jgi:hypothetical protein